MRIIGTYGKPACLSSVFGLLLALAPADVFAQGSVFGSVRNSDASTPVNGQISFFGFLDNTDSEIRIESSTGAGYDNGNWFDDFQNYLTEVAGNPYDYYFINPSISEGFHLAKFIPNNSFQQENIILGPVSWPGQPFGLSGFAVSPTVVEISWSAQAGLTHHVYRRLSASNGSLFRIDDPSGNLASPGVSSGFFVDPTVDGISSYDYVIIAEDAAGNYSAHSAVLTVNSALVTSPIIFSVIPPTGLTIGGTDVEINGNGFDLAGMNVLIGGTPLTNITVVSPSRIIGQTPPGIAGPANVSVANIASGLVSNTLVGGFTYTVNNPPVLSPIGPQSITEGGLLTISVTATDSDGGFPVLSAAPLPPGASFTDNGDGSGAFDWPTTFFDAGSFIVTFVATDDVLATIADSEQVTITVVDAGNQVPALTPIGPQSTSEDLPLTFAVSASDIESIPSLTAVGLPVGALFTDNGDGTGQFDWTPDFLQSGLYNVTFIALDDSLAADSEVVAVTVLEIGNQLPVLAAIGPQSTTEGAPLAFSVTAVDAESVPVLSGAVLPPGATFIDNGDGSGNFSWTPSFSQSGVFSVTFAATDDSLAVDSEVVSINVIEAGNQPPVLSPIGPKSTLENAPLTFVVTASDVESTPTLSATGLPVGANFGDNGNGTGVFDWTPTLLQAGVYNVTFVATDDLLAVATEIVTITVLEVGNQTPVLLPIGPQTTNEAVPLSFALSATDIESIPALSASPLPAGAALTDNGDGTGAFNWTPSLVQAGIYSITFAATDDSLAVASETVTVTVLEVGNQAPVLSTIGARATNEGATLSFTFSATDAESTPALSALALPVGASLTDNGDGTGVFDWSPTFTQSGVYFVTFTATDDSLAADSEVVIITVNEMGNQAPTLDPVGFKVVIEGTVLSFAVTASDAESDPQILASGLPNGAGFVDNGDGSGSFNWTPTFIQSGDYNVTLFARDDSLSVVSEIITITVLDAGNQPPALAPIGPKVVNENVNLSFAVTATDGESVPTLAATGLPAGATFTDNADGSGLFDWTPSFLQAGQYSVLFTVTDDSTATDSERVTITVTETGNQAPVLSPIGPQNVTEGQTLGIPVIATDAESVPTLSALSLPLGATFIDNGDGTGSFDWTPGFLQSGVFIALFIATDASFSADSELVTITVLDAGNQPPLVVQPGPQTGVESQLLAFTVSATDAESIPTLSAFSLPPGAGFTDNLNGTGLFSWTPDFLQAGNYSVLFVAADDSLAVDSEFVSVTVTDGGNQPPILAPIGPKSTTELVNLTFSITATDVESIPSFSAAQLPAGAALVDSGNGIAVFNWTPSLTDGGDHLITFIATDDLLASDSETVVITVLDVGNQPPALDSIPALFSAEGSLLSLTVSATDVESIPVLTHLGLPLGAIFTDNLDGTGLFSWTPDFTQSGIYSVTFVATDDSLVSDSEMVSITITEQGNQPPVIAVVTDTSVAEGNVLTLVITATDPEAAGPVFISSVSSLSNSIFTDSGNGVATLVYSPTFLDAGINTVRIFATDAGLPPSTSQIDVTITTVEVNQPPVIDSVGPFSILVGRDLVFDVVVSDSTDANAANRVSLTVINLPFGATFVDNLDNTGTFTLTATPALVGVHTVRFLAIDMGVPPQSDFIDVTITIVAQNQAPTIASIPPSAVDEGGALVIPVSATDPDLDPLAISTRNAPANSSFADNGDGTGTFTFNPDFTQGGSSGASQLYSVSFVVSDGMDDDRTQALIQVNDAGNQAPVITATDTSVIEGNLLTHTVSAVDPDGSTPTLSADSLPGNATFTDNGDGTGTINFTPDFVQAGTYTVFVNASDDVQTTVTSLIITVIDAGNQPPQLAFDSLQLDQIETDLISFTLIATDPDATVPVMSIQNMPAGATFVDSGNGRSSFVWQTQNLDVGTYNVAFFARDALDPLIFDSAIVTLNIADSNFVPLIFPAQGQNRTVSEGQTLTYVVNASDADGTIPVLTTDVLFPNMSFNDVGDGTGILTFTPDFTQGSNSPGTPYQVDFIATDAVDPTKTKSTSPQLFLVVQVNQPPVVTPVPSPVSIVEGGTLTFTVSSSDPDLANPSPTFPVLRAENLPPNAGVSNPPGGDLTRLDFTFTPDFTQSGTFIISFIASDTQAEDTELVQIDVLEAGNQNPIWLTVFLDTTLVVAGQLSEFPLATFEPDNDPVTISNDFSPIGSALIDSTNGAGSFIYNPDAFDVGAAIPIQFFATDPAGASDTVATVFVVRAFLRGDANTDTRVDLTDIVFLIDFIFRSGVPPVSFDAADADFDSRIRITDVTFLINYLYRNGPPPPN